MATRDLAADGKKWAALHEDWVFANQDYLKASRASRDKFIDCAAGRGTGPSLAELEEVDRLEKIANDKRGLTQAFLHEVFG